MKPIKKSPSFAGGGPWGKPYGIGSTRINNIEDRQIAPIEKLLRSMDQRKKYKEAGSQGDDSTEVNIDFGAGGGDDSCKEVDGKMVCSAYDGGSADGGASSDGGGGETKDRKSLALSLAEGIANFRDFRQTSLGNRKSNVLGRRYFGTKNNPTNIENPFAKARYKSLQRRLARSEGRENAGGGGGMQLINASF